MKEYANMTITQLVNEQKQIQDKLEKAKEEKTKLQKQFDLLRETIIPEKMESEGISSIVVDGVGRISLTSDIRVSVLADDRPKAQSWLIDHGHEDLITKTVNASTLKAFCKEQLKAGEELPSFFKITPFTRSSITKS